MTMLIPAPSLEAEKINITYCWNCKLRLQPAKAEQRDMFSIETVIRCRDCGAENSTTVEIDDQHAIMDQATFDTVPTLVPRSKRYPGKQWRVHFRGKWWLMWFDEALTKHWREILIAEEVN